MAGPNTYQLARHKSIGEMAVLFENGNLTACKFTLPFAILHIKHK
jgi:hypothetical protein